MWSGLAQRQSLHETSYVARVYADSLRDNFVGYTPADLPSFAALKAEFEAERDKVRPYFAELLKIEMALVDLMPDAVVASRFWAVDDRFRRVVPINTRDTYDKSVPGRGDVKWQDASFLRLQTKSLLDTIHSNYLLNIGREQSIKRLKAIITIAASLLIIISLCTWQRTDDAGTHGLMLLAGAGVFGAYLSVLNRLQNAVARDPMSEDGIYELTGLRVGWVGILMSFVMGGGFAIVIYWLVLSGVLALALPQQTLGSSSNGSDNSTTTANSTAPSSSPNATSNAALEVAANATAAVAPAASNATAKSELEASAKRVMGKPGSSPVPKTVDVKKPFAPHAADSLHPENARFGGLKTDEIGKALGFGGAADFLKMLLLAFLAGFAERLVPDILNRLSKQESNR